MLQTESIIIHHRFPFAFHASQSHAYPSVQAAVHVAAVRPWRGEVIRRASDNAVEFHNHFGIQVVAACGDLPHFGFEVLH